MLLLLLLLSMWSGEEIENWTITIGFNWKLYHDMWGQAILNNIISVSC